MANTSYTMQQYRYTGRESECMKQVTANPLYLDWQVESTSEPFYRDIVIEVPGELKANQDYCITFGIPRDMNYNLNFGVKLMNRNANFNDFLFSNSQTRFQFCRYITTAKTAGNGTANSLVCLYKIKDSLENDSWKTPRTARRSLAGTNYQPGENASVDPWLTTSGGKLSPSNIANYDTRKSGIFYEVNGPKADHVENGKITVPGYYYYPNVLYHNYNDEWWMFQTADADKIPKKQTGKDNDGNPILVPKGRVFTENGASVYVVTQDGDPWGANNVLEGTSDAVLNWVWQIGETSVMSYYKMIIRPQENFMYILLQLERIAEDPDIVTVHSAGDGENLNRYFDSLDADGNPVYKDIYVGQQSQGQQIHGRYVDLTKGTGNTITKNGQEVTETVADTFKVYELNNLITEGSGFKINASEINRIGVWGHPELMMAINGEEIQIGSSGYYELNDFPIESFAVVADGRKDTFTVDFQYKA